MKVSCVMPTFNRREFIPAAIDCYRAQSWLDKELIILDDGDDPVKDLVPAEPDIKYLTCKKANLGEKLNICCEEAKGEAICHFDDDDWSTPGRIEKQVSRLQAGHALTGFSNILYLDIRTGKYYRWRRPRTIYGCSLCYEKSVWEIIRFQPFRRGTDMPFIEGVNVLKGGHDTVDESGYIVGRIHNFNLTHWLGLNFLTICDGSDIPQGFMDNERLRNAV